VIVGLIAPGVHAGSGKENPFMKRTWQDPGAGWETGPNASEASGSIGNWLQLSAAMAVAANRTEKIRIAIRVTWAHLFFEKEISDIPVLHTIQHGRK
jgi:hypothetical protein